MMRTAHHSDLGQLLAIEAAQFQHDSLSRRSMIYMIKNPQARFIVRDYDGLIAGYVILLEHKRSRSARLYSIAVETSFQGKGIADELMDQLERICAKPCIKLEVRSDNLRALSFYERRGFTKTGLRPEYYSDGNSATLMLKRLQSDGQ